MSSSPTSNKVPYFVLQLENGKARVLFTVPTELAPALSQHPIMCRGACFVLELDAAGSDPARSPTTFLSTVFESPLPDETARAISERIAIRIGDPSPGMSQMFGFR